MRSGGCHCGTMTRHMDAALESIADGVDRQLDPRVIPLQRLRNTITAVILTAMSFVGLIIVWVATSRWAAGLLLVPLWLLLSGLLVWQLRRWPAIAYRHSSYRVDALGIEIRRGVYWRDITNVPRSRVQHTDVSQGPIERRFASWHPRHPHRRNSECEGHARGSRTRDGAADPGASSPRH